MKDDLNYPKAVGLLQANCTHAASQIEILARYASIEDWAKTELLSIARLLRDANDRAEELTEYPRPVRASDHAEHFRVGTDL